MSQAATGVPKTAEHKAKIAAAQRRRHAAARALTAVEAFHRGSDSALPAGWPCASLHLCIFLVYFLKGHQKVCLL